MPTAICLGEALVDFLPAIPGKLQDVEQFRRCPGGAPANVAVGLSRLGIRAGFLGCLGDDPFGRYLAETLTQEGVDTSQIQFTSQALTPVAFVALDEYAERQFLFYRHPGADTLLSPDAISRAYLLPARILHFGTLSLSAEPSASATRKALKLAQELGLWRSLDVNLRLPLWPSLDAARRAVASVLAMVTVLKVNQEELAFLSGSNELQAAKTLLLAGPKLVVVTMGAQGSYACTEGVEAYAPAPQVATVDTTGAGDAFTAAFLARLLWRGVPPAQLDRWELVADLRWANCAAALATTRLGAIPALPTRQEVENLALPPLDPK